MSSAAGVCASGAPSADGGSATTSANVRRRTASECSTNQPPCRYQRSTTAPHPRPPLPRKLGDRFGSGSVPVQAFGAALAGAPRTSDSGVWAYDLNDDKVELVAREGAEPPGAPGTRWKAFTSLSVLEGRGPMFTATLGSGTAKVTPKTDAGLWATDSTGALRLIFREGQEIVPDKTLRSFDVLESVAGSPGQRRAWTGGDASGRVIYRAFFTDGTTAILSTAVP